MNTINYEAMKHFRIGFKNFAPVSGKPLNAELLFDNRVIGEFQSLNRTLAYNHPNYNIHSVAYDFDGNLYQVLKELNDEIFAGFSIKTNPVELNNLYIYLTRDNRFMLPVKITDKTIASKFNQDKVNLQAIVDNAVKSFN
jgi:hypothetical protein